MEPERFLGQTVEAARRHACIYDRLSRCILSFIGRNHVKNHVKWVSCHHSMARPQVADGGDALQMWRVKGKVVPVLN
jgi:hypothetical protein